LSRGRASGQQNFFELLGLDRTFAVDEKSLNNAHKKLQREWHPDKFTRSEKDRKAALDTSARINVAYDTLKKPHLRARYLLEQEGIGIEEGDANIDDIEFLDYVMGMREALDEHPDEEQLKTLKETSEKQLQECLKKAEAAFNRLSEGDDFKEQARKEASKLQYLNRMMEEIVRQTQVK